MSTVQFEIMVESFHQICLLHGGWLGAGHKVFTQKMTDIACVACECDKRSCLIEEAERRKSIFKSLRSTIIHVVGTDVWLEKKLSYVVATEAAQELAHDSRLNMRRIIADGLAETCKEPSIGRDTLEFGIGLSSMKAGSLHEDVGFIARGDLFFRIEALGSIWRELSGLGINPCLINDSLGMARRLARFFDEEGARIVSIMEAKDLSCSLPAPVAAAPRHRI